MGGGVARLIQLCGQVSVVSVYIMEALRMSDGSFTVSLLLAAGLLAVCAVAVSRLKDAAPVAAPEGATATFEGRPREEVASAVPAPPAGD